MVFGVSRGPSFEARKGAHLRMTLGSWDANARHRAGIRAGSQ
jgi:hypothetical protein